MKDPRFASLYAAMDRFLERLHWLLPNGSRERVIPVDVLQALLAEWEELEAQMELLEAIGGPEKIKELLGRIGELKARVRVGFLIQVGRLLLVIENRWLNEFMMRVPGILKKLPPAEQQPPKATELWEQVQAALPVVNEPERMFRESMEAADACEQVEKQLSGQLLAHWPEHWTPAIQQQLAELTPPDLASWREALQNEALELEQRHPGVIQFAALISDS